ncbi:MAG: ABC transporter permease [Gemmataceae bacterium]
MSTQSAYAVPKISLRRHFMVSALAALFVLTLRQNLRGRRPVVLSVLFLLPVILGGVLKFVPYPPTPDELEFVLIFNLIPYTLAPLTALLYAAGTIQDEVEEQTLTYLLLRPLPRWALYGTRLAAVWLTTSALTGFFSVLTLIAIHWDRPEMWSEWLPRRAALVAALMALAQVGYCAGFGVLGLPLRRSLIIGLGYIIAIEGMLSNFDAVVRRLTVTYYFRVLSLHWLLPSRDKEWSLDLTSVPSVNDCLWTLLGVSAALLLVGAVMMRQREFRMKTAEGS